MKPRKNMTREERRMRWIERAIIQRTILICVVAVALIIAAIILTVIPSEAEAINPIDDPVKGDPPVLLKIAAEAPEESVAECLAKLIWGEARGCPPEKQAAVVWCVLNRVESDDPYYPNDIIDVVKQAGQFTGYSVDNPVLEDLVALAEDVLARWEIEGKCVGDVGRVLPKEYLFFSGDGEQNYFRTEYTGGKYWDWDCIDPY